MQVSESLLWEVAEAVRDGRGTSVLDLAQILRTSAVKVRKALNLLIADGEVKAQSMGTETMYVPSCW